jgi:hypothetical protein
MEATLRLDAAEGKEKPLFLGLLVNELESGEHACYVIQSTSATRQTMLLADSGVGVVQYFGSSVRNHQCEVSTDTPPPDGTGSSATFHIRFSPTFKGAKHIWGIAMDAQMNGPAKMLGEWVVE